MSTKHQRCPECKSLATQRWGRRKVGSRKIQRFRCLVCGQTFTKKVFRRIRIAPTEQVRLTREHLEKRASIRTLARLEGYSKQTVQNAIHTVTAQCASAAWIAQTFAPVWGGYLALDGTTIRVWDWAAKYFRYSKTQRRWLHKMSLLMALDIATLDIPVHHLGDEETMIDLKLMLDTLKTLHYPLKGIVTDGNEDIARAVALVFGPGIPHQLCQLHWLRSLRQKVREGTVSEHQRNEAWATIPKGRRPSFPVPDQLFTYLQHPGLPKNNQALEVCHRFLKLRLKSIGTFHSWQTAAHYLDALVAHRRFLKFSDRKNGQPNGQAPLELAGCTITGWDYLTRKKTNH
ncbi:MAG: hypothetical protein Q7K33_03785 [Candidatus Berkelbacteria bacterium]|nr:hypothetical protein [Candidatus Berkelbacteria bacterium]